MTLGKATRRGGPLVTIALVGALWVAARVVLWETPYSVSQMSLPGTGPASAQGLSGDYASSSVERQRFPDGPSSTLDDRVIARAAQAIAEQSRAVFSPPAAQQRSGFVRVPIGKDVVRVSLKDQSERFATEAAWAAAQRDYAASTAIGHQMLWQNAMAQSARGRLGGEGIQAAAYAPAQGDGVSPASPIVQEDSDKVDRWTLDVWGFYRQGSEAAPITQGRVPTYGASQSGAKLRYRLAPQSGHDPVLFARAYQALIANGESEFAVGASARPFPKIPIRLVGEMRGTQTPAGLQFRPAAYAFTELPPVGLPAGFMLEAYAQGGYVGGENATPFADAQATVTRELFTLPKTIPGNPRLSFGGGIWGGAQQGASRVDIGPTMRLDMMIGKLPARFTVDWRQQVAGDAAPESGVAATISTQF